MYDKNANSHASINRRNKFRRGFFVTEEMVDLLFEAMTHSDVKSGLINGRAMLHEHAYTVREHIHRAYERYGNEIGIFFDFLFRMSLKRIFNE